LNFSRPQTDQRRFPIRLVLDPLEFQSIQIHLGHVARREAVTAKDNFPIPIDQIFLGILQHGFGLKRLDKSVAQVEDQIPLLIGQAKLRQARGLFGAIQPQLAFAVPLVQITDTGGFDHPAERTPYAKISRNLNPIRRQTDVRIGPKICGNFTRLGLIHQNAISSQRGIVRQELNPGLFPGQYRLLSRADGASSYQQRD